MDVLFAVLLVAAFACSGRQHLGWRRRIPLPLLSSQRQWLILVQRLRFV
jgi:hypothetical protein